MYKHIWIVMACVAMSIKPSFGQEKKNNTKPNIIMLMADDLGWGDVGFNGNTKIITPNLDQMAQSGVRFTNFYAAAPLCSPTRASCLTGRNPFRQGIFAAHTGGMRVAETTIAEILKEQGYRTGFFGKWHLGWIEADKVESRGFYSPPRHHGYDESFATKSAVPTWNPTKTPKGWTSWGSMKDGSWGGSIYLHDGEPVTNNLDGDDSRIIMDRAIPFIEKALENKKPFFTTIWFHAPHEPIVAGPDYLKKYPDLPEEQKHLYGCITAMDEQIGRLRTFLKEQNLDKNTIIFFCSDNGPADPQAKRGIASAGPYRGHKHQMWEGGLRVPSVVEWPGHIQEGLSLSYQASTVDYLPTILDVLNLSKPKAKLDGMSLMPAIYGETKTRSVPLAFGYYRLYQGTQLDAYIEGQYKICIPEKGKKMMLFDLNKDPSETKDLALEKPELLKRMKAELEKVKKDWQNSYNGKDYKW